MRVQPEPIATTPGVLHDAFGRRLQYLRLSITDRCNFRCTYCLPDGCRKDSDDRPLSPAEIERLVRGFAGLGFWKVRLTGGEPTLRRDLVEIVRRVSAVPGVRRVGLTTNGGRLAALAPRLAAAGLSSVNVSLDSLDEARFGAITGVARRDDVVAGIEAAVAAGIPSVKVNAVLLAGLDGAELDRFLAWARPLPITLRFIELMRTAGNAKLCEQEHVTAAEIERQLVARGWTRLERVEGDGPATTYGHAAHRGSAGVIAPYSEGFCASCNRVRVSSSGNLRLCLFGNAEVPLRHLLRSDLQQRELEDAVSLAVHRKPASHELTRGASGGIRSLASIGG